jgi:hypothetical protein
MPGCSGISICRSASYFPGFSIGQIGQNDDNHQNNNDNNNNNYNYNDQLPFPWSNSRIIVIR